MLIYEDSFEFWRVIVMKNFVLQEINYYFEWCWYIFYICNLNLLKKLGITKDLLISKTFALSANGFKFIAIKISKQIKILISAKLKWSD